MRSTPVRVTRNIIAIVCLIAAVGTAMSANFGVFAKRQLYNNQAFVQHTDHLLANPDVRESIATQITDQIVQQVPQLKPFSRIVTTAASELVGTKQFREVFDRALSSAQQQIVAGKPAITLDLGAAVQPLVNELTGGIPFIQSLIPDLSGVLEVTVLTKTQAPQLWSWVDRTDTAATWSWIITLVLLGLAILLMTKHWLAVAGAGASVAVAAVICWVGAIGLQSTLRSQFAPGVEQRTFQAVYDEFSGAYGRQTFVMLLLGGVVLVAGVVAELITVSVRRRSPAPNAQGAPSVQPGPSAAAMAAVPAAPATPTTRPGPPLLDE